MTPLNVKDGNNSEINKREVHVNWDRLCFYSSQAE